MCQKTLGTTLFCCLCLSPSFLSVFVCVCVGGRGGLTACTCITCFVNVCKDDFYPH